ncbi:MAG: hypothetical protein LBO64_05310 [Desulfovibrio sp.]|jgi:hypothetical protein|nr:hypothetical protein [Desulfovibrio sp.]
MGEMASQLQRLEKIYPQCIPDISKSSTVYCFSDYSGDIKSDKYNTYSFLLTDDSSIILFSKEHKIIRQKYGIEKRKFSYKDLSDNVLRNAHNDFLTLANGVNGILLSVAINKKLHLDFKYDNRSEDFLFLNVQKPKNVQRILTISHLAALFLAGILHHNQNIMWITDNDNIIANDKFTIQLTNIAASLISTLVDFNLGHFRCGSSRCDCGDNLIEDFLSIPDFAAGTLSNQLGTQISDEYVFWMQRGDAKEKQNKLSLWLASSRTPLRKYIFILDPGSVSEKVKTSFFHFYDRQ